MNEETLFELAVNADEAERAALLDQHCENRPQLRERVEKLIAAHFDPQTGGLDPTAMQDVLADDSGRKPVTAPNHRSSLDAGSVLAERYTLRELIAEGGMGAVWLASQKTPVKRKVAVKLIKPGMDSRQVIARFEAERQALAVMDHPNIAKVFDGGMTDQGRPYFVMEYVKGVPLTEYCDQARLSVKERLELFIPICQAVQHAHHKGIVHRDLKPSNILVCLYDGKPVPKVIDFGLAKAMHQPLTEHSIMTSHGVMVGTPLYMSPEQAEYNNLDVDTRTDIYSLGVVLYELLTGTTPLEREQLRAAAYNEVLRLIKEVEPLRPSMRLSKSTTLPNIAAQRSIDPKNLGKALSRDLDWVVMKSLAKERTRRYETAAGFARDIENFLNEEAVDAGPPSGTYRLGKYLKKHKLQAIASAVMLLALVVGTAAATWGWLKASEAENKVRASLAEVIAERDAKNEALSAVEAQREVAERALIDGLLRPIGFGGEAEAKAFEDWSKIADDRLKLRVFEVGMERPDTAVRLQNNSFKMLSACVGFSPSRRKKVTDLLDALLKNPQSDPIASGVAVALKIELSGIDDDLIDRIISEFRRYAVWSKTTNSLVDLLIAQRSRISETQADQLCKTCLTAETIQSKEKYELGKLFDEMCQKVPGKLIKQYCDQLLDIMDTAENDGFAGEWVANRLEAIDDRLADYEVDRRWQALTKALESHMASGSSLTKLLPFVSDSEVGEVWRIISKQYETGYYVDDVGFKAAALRVSHEQVQVAWDAICSAMKNELADDGWGGIEDYSDTFDFLASLMSEKQLINNYIQANSIDDNAGGFRRVLKRDVLAALIPRLPPEQHDNALNQTLQIIVDDQVEGEFSGSVVLGKLAANASASQILDAWNELLNQISSPTFIYSDDNEALKCMCILATHMTEKQFKSATAAVFQPGGELDNVMSPVAISRALVALSPRLPEGQAWEAWQRISSEILQNKDAFLSVVEWNVYGAPDSSIGNAGRVANAIQTLASIIPGQRSVELQRELLRLQQQSTSEFQRLFIIDLMRSFASRLPEPLVDKYFAVALEILADETTGNPRGSYLYVPAWSLLMDLMPRLSSPQIETITDLLTSTDHTLAVPTCGARLMEQCSSSEQTQFARSIFKSNTENSRKWKIYCYPELASALMDAKFLAWLLVQPQFAENEHQVLLQRFEELVLYDGQNVFLDTDRDDDATEPTDSAEPRKPDRQFLTIWDAARWIEKNWPDYDLDAVPEFSSEQAGG